MKAETRTNQERRVWPKTCAICGTEFISMYHQGKYCCEECAQEGKRQNTRDYRARNPEKIKQQLRESYYRHREARMAYLKSYYWKNRERLLDYNKKWREGKKAKEAAASCTNAFIADAEP